MEDDKRSYYAIIPANVRYDDTISANAKLLYGEITALCNERGYCWASNEYFAQLYHVSKSSVSKWISSLVQHGYVEIEIKYKDGTKEIVNRLLRISMGMAENCHTYGKNLPEGMAEIYHTPMVKIYSDNNTYNNNTVNNTDDVEEKKNRIDYQAIVDDYNSTCPNLPKVNLLSEARKKTIKARLKTIKPEQLHNAFEKANASDFLTGKVESNGRTFKATFDWILKESNIVKVLDGNYDNRGNNVAQNGFYGAEDTLPF